MKGLKIDVLRRGKSAGGTLYNNHAKVAETGVLGFILTCCGLDIYRKKAVLFQAIKKTAFWRFL